METHNPPSKVARIAEHGPRSCDNVGEGFSPPLDLVHEHSCQKYCGFTLLQLQELEHQALIYKYMEAGVTVPHHLILPIWKSLSGLKGRVHQHYPNFLGCSPLYCDYRNNMDPEPRRCRRTDGKKWRCRKDAIPDQKYCESHMNRGRLRSRKHGKATSTTTMDIHISSSTNLSISLPSNNSSISPKIVIHGGGAHKTESAL